MYLEKRAYTIARQKAGAYIKVEYPPRTLAKISKRLDLFANDPNKWTESGVNINFGDLFLSLDEAKRFVELLSHMR